MMVETVQDFRTAGIRAPVLVGGAALSNRFTPPPHRTRIRRAGRLLSRRHERVGAGQHHTGLTTNGELLTARLVSESAELQQEVAARS